MEDSTRKPKSGIVEYKLVPMQASHLETSAGKTRCRLCWLLGVTTPTPGQKSTDHFCRWNIENDARPDPFADRQMYRQPIFKRKED